MAARRQKSVTRKRVKVTTLVVSDELNIDIGADGKVYGIELLNANQQLGSRNVKKLIIENGDPVRKLNYL